MLIIDEALAVGDIYFQRKCYRRIEELREAGCTLLLVTHSMDSLLQLCDRGVLLEGGKLLFDGDCKQVVAEYMKCLFGRHLGAAEEPADETQAADAPEESPLEDDERSQLERGGHRDLFFSRAGYNRGENRLGDGRALVADMLISSSMGHGPIVPAREPFSIFVRYAFAATVDRLVFGLQVRTVDGLVIYSTNTFVTDSVFYAFDAGDVVVAQFRLRCSLLPSQYFLTLGVSRIEPGEGEVTAIDRRVDSVILTVLGDRGHTNGYADMEAAVVLSRAGDRAVPRRQA